MLKATKMPPNFQTVNKALATFFKWWHYPYNYIHKDEKLEEKLSPFNMAQSETSPNISSDSDYKPMIVSNPDGTYTRLVQLPTVPASPDPDSSSSPILTKDIPINLNNKTWLRLYLPRHLLHTSSTTINRRLPVVFYYHGGGFIFVSAASRVTNDFCCLLSQRIDAVVISVEYRLAPEHRLPAAYEDCVEALHCIKSSQEDWIKNFADLSCCFVMGTSAGGNIAYHAGLRACELGSKLEPLKIKGLLLHHPYFGGSERTGSELKLANDPVLPLRENEFMWELSLPVGADRDHEYCNPMTGFGSNVDQAIREMGLRVLVTGCYGDPLIDRQMEFSKMLEEKGVKIVGHFGEGSHGMEFLDLSKAELLFPVLKDFMSSSSN